MYFPAAVSQCIARSILAYYQELFGQDTNPIQKFNETNFLTTIGVQNWNTSKHNPYAEFDLELVKHSIPESYTYRSYYPDYTFLYAQGGAIISAKVDAVTDYRKDDHLTLQVTFDPKGRLFSIIGSIDLFDRIHDKGYTPPTSGLLTYNDQGQIIRVSQGGKQIFGYDSLINAYIDQFRNSLEQTHTDRITVQQTGLIEASLKVVAAIEAAL